MEILIWSIVILLMLAGLVGSVVPLLPGTTLWIIGFWALSVLADLGCTLLGTKLFGGGKWGMAGASGGALAGMFFSLPALLLGTMLGAIVAEKWLGKKTDGQALRAGAGAAVGFVMSSFAKLMCAVMMIGFYTFAVLNAVGPTAAVSTV
jgi:uncharacterized protein YqgC (DUF456 family)